MTRDAAPGHHGVEDDLAITQAQLDDDLVGGEPAIVDGLAQRSSELFDDSLKRGLRAGRPVRQVGLGHRLAPFGERLGAGVVARSRGLSASPGCGVTAHEPTKDLTLLRSD